MMDLLTYFTKFWIKQKQQIIYEWSDRNNFKDG